MAEKFPFFIGELASGPSAVSVIMAGGSGTRFWPVSRTLFPKQFLPLGNDKRSLIQATADRVVPIVGSQATLVVTTSHQTSLVREHLPEAAIISEPAARNTAACIGFAALAVRELVGDVPMICLPADHLILHEEVLQARYRAACDIARTEDLLLTIGIAPTSPETGYGYIEAGRERAPGIFDVQRFCEKPDLQRAKEFVATGRFSWNSGMFIWRPSVVLEALREHQPELHAGLLSIVSNRDAAPTVLLEQYAALPSVSIDTGVLERASNVAMLPGTGFFWSDIGSWHSWAENAERSTPAGQQVCLGDGIFIDTERCAVFSRSATEQGKAKEKLIALVGVQDVVVVDTDDAILVCHRSRAQDVKHVVDTLKQRGRKNLL